MAEPIRLPVRIVEHATGLRCGDRAIESRQPLAVLRDAGGCIVALCERDEDAVAIRDALNAMAPAQGYVDIVFDAPPGPVSGRFIEVEDASGKSISWFGEWVHRADGYWVLRIALNATAPTDEPCLHCDGTGKHGPDACEVCRGSGRLPIEHAQAPAQAPAVAGLEDEALADVFDRAYAEATRDFGGEAMADKTLGDLHDHARKVAAAKLRDHVLRTLAALAGDPEALTRTGHDALRQNAARRGWLDIRPYDEMDDSFKSDYRTFALAAVAPVALALMRAYRALESAVRFAGDIGAGDDCIRLQEARSIVDAPLPAAVTAAAEAHDRAVSPDDLRADGWMVAVHNDYTLNGERRTFWLLTKDGYAIKGEGRTDAEALAQVRDAARVQAAAAVRESGLREQAENARHDARETRREVLAVREDLADSTRELREASARESGLREALRDIGAFADAHHADQGPNVWLHALTVDIPDRVERTLADPSPAAARVEAVVEAAREMDERPCHTTHSDDCACSRLRKALHELDGGAS